MFARKLLLLHSYTPYIFFWNLILSSTFYEPLTTAQNDMTVTSFRLSADVYSLLNYRANFSVV